MQCGKKELNFCWNVEIVFPIFHQTKNGFQMDNLLIVNLKTNAVTQALQDHLQKVTLEIVTLVQIVGELAELDI